MEALPLPLLYRVSREALTAWAGPRSVQRGVVLWHGALLFAREREGTLLRARCEGRELGPYELELDLRAWPPEAARCTCPAMERGPCKHLVALALDAQASPSRYEPRAPLVERVAGLSPGALRGLLEGLCAEVSGARAWLRGRLEPELTEDSTRAPLGPALREAARSEDAGALAALLPAQEPSARGAVRENLAQACALLARGLLEGAEEAPRALAVDAVERLGALAQHEDAAVRRASVEALWLLHRSEREAGRGLLGGRPEHWLRNGARREELEPALAAARERWLHAEHEGERRSAGRDLLLLGAEGLREEELARLCREHHRPRPMVRRLLGAGREEEALAWLEGLGFEQVAQLGEEFRGERADAALGRWVEAQAQRGVDPRWWHLLLSRAEAREDWERAWALRSRLWLRRPDEEGWRALGELAEKLGKGSQERSLLLDTVLGMERVDPELLAVLLAEGRYAEAAELAGSTRLHAGPRAQRARVELARALESAAPQEARSVYEGLLEGLLPARGREAAQEARELLRRLREVHRALRETERWARWLLELRGRAAGGAVAEALAQLAGGAQDAA